jgi:hypothetical protein
MAWRWDWDQEEHSYELDSSVYPGQWIKPEGEGWFRDARNGWHRQKANPTGYCGLAERGGE